MASTVAVPRRTRVHPDRVFFPAMCLLILVTVWLGFAKTYYAAGLFKAPLPSPIIHVHAVVFTLWLATLVVQTALVSARRVKLHMALGLWGFGLAAAMIVIGAMAAVDSLRRNMSPPGSGLSALTFFVVPVTTLMMFAVLAGCSYALRRKPVQHKRLILLASIVLLDAAIGRFPYTITPMGPVAQLGILCVFLVIMMGYDLYSQKKIVGATWIGSLGIVVLQAVRVPLAQLEFWQHFARMVHG